MKNESKKKEEGHLPKAKISSKYRYGIALLLSLIIGSYLIKPKMVEDHFEEKPSVSVGVMPDEKMFRERANLVDHIKASSNNATLELNKQIEGSYLKQYVKECFVVNSNPDKRNLYVILQKHAQNDKRVDKDIHNK